MIKILLSFIIIQNIINILSQINENIKNFNYDNIMVLLNIKINELLLKYFINLI